MERGTYLPEPVSEKKVEKPVSCLEGDASDKRPSGYLSSQYIYHELKIQDTYAKTVLEKIEFP
jgi:hypothetical protein